MNFFASSGFLDATAAVYFKDRPATIENVRIGDDVLRLLVVDGKKIITRLLFLDYHEPLPAGEIAEPVRSGLFADRVSRGVIDVDDRSDQELAPFVDWRRFSGFDHYYDRLLERHHGLMRDRERRERALVSRFGNLIFTLDDRSEDVLPLVRQWKGGQLRSIGLPDFFTDPRTMAFFDHLQQRGLLTTSTLRAGGRLVSAWIGFIHQGAWSGWIFTYDPTLKKYSPGHQLLVRMLETSYELGHREFDFSIGAQDYKLLYASHGRVLAKIGNPSTVRATMMLARDALLQHSPELFAAALRGKWALQAAKRHLSLAIAMRQS
jgi:hypothetical protein